MLALCGVHLKFNFLRCDGNFASRSGSEISGYGTKMARGADDQLRLDLQIHDPRIACSLDGLERNGLEKTRAAALEQKIVKFAAANSVADWPRVIGGDFWAADPAGKESGNRLQHAAATIFFEINLEFFDDCGSDPSAANFIAREHGAIEDCVPLTLVVSIPPVR